MNVFNLSDQTRTITGTCPLARLGLDPRKQYRTASDWATVRKGQFSVSLSMPPWSAQVAEVRPGR